MVICPTIKSPTITNPTQFQKIINPTTQKIICPTDLKKIKTPTTQKIICPTGKVEHI